MAENAILYDSSKCSACKGCQVMCKQWNMLPSSLGKNTNEFTGTYQSMSALNGDTRLMITFDEKATDKGIEWAFMRKACFHCTDPACLPVCPKSAISKLDNGTVSSTAPSASAASTATPPARSKFPSIGRTSASPTSAPCATTVSAKDSSPPA